MAQPVRWWSGHYTNEVEGRDHRGGRGAPGRRAGAAGMRLAERALLLNAVSVSVNDS